MFILDEIKGFVAEKHTTCMSSLSTFYCFVKNFVKMRKKIMNCLLSTSSSFESASSFLSRATNHSFQYIGLEAFTKKYTQAHPFPLMYYTSVLVKILRSMYIIKFHVASIY